MSCCSFVPNTFFVPSSGGDISLTSYVHHIALMVTSISEMPKISGHIAHKIRRKNWGPDLYWLASRVYARSPTIVSFRCDRPSLIGSFRIMLPTVEHGAWISHW